jgi:HAD superfamily hydrolase (TIGR01509 family)
VTVRALLFDFDGLIVETEGPAFEAWRQTYARYGAELTLADWSAAVGTVNGFDPVGRLEELTGLVLDRDELRELTWAEHRRLVADEALRPGISEYLADAFALGLDVAVVSSAGRAWVTGHLEQRGIGDGWHSIHCADGDPSIAKPRPDLYLAALAALRVPAEHGIAIEDSPNGVAAAKAAGLVCVAVPNPVTRELDLGAADLVLDSLADLPLSDLLAWAERSRTGAAPTARRS